MGRQERKLRAFLVAALFGWLGLAAPSTMAHHGAWDVQCVGGNFDAGDNATYASTYISQSSCEGADGNEVSVDWYKKQFYRTDGVGITSTAGSAAFCVFMPNGTFMFCGKDEAAAPVDGEYLMRVSSPTNANAPPGNYFVHWYRWRNGDCGHNWDFGPDGAGDHVKATPYMCDGRFEPSVGDDIDSYGFFGVVGQHVALNVSDGTVVRGDVETCLHRPGTYDAPVACIPPGQRAVNATLDAEGYWRAVARFRPNDAPLVTDYGVTINTTWQNDCGYGADAQPNINSPLLPIPTGCRGHLLTTMGDTADYLRISGTGGTTIGIDLRLDTPGAQVEICTHWTGVANPCATTSGGAIGFTRTIPSDGNWAIQIKNPTMETAYQFAVARAMDCGSGDATPTAPRTLALPATCSGSLEPVLNDSSDHYRFTAQGVPVRVTSDGRARVCLTDAGGAPHGCLAQAGTIDTFSEASGSWRVVVDQGTGDYGFTARVAHDDCGAGADAGNTAAAARRVTISGALACDGFVATAGDTADWLVTSAAQGTLVEAEVDPASPIPLDACLSTATGSDCVAPLSLVSPGGDARLELRAAGTTGFYRVHLRATPQDDCGLGLDLGNNATAARRVTATGAGVACDGTLYADGDAADWLVANATLGALVEATLDDAATTIPVDVCLRTASASGNASDCDAPRALVSPGGDARLEVRANASAPAGARGAWRGTFRVTPQDDCASARDAGPVGAMPVTFTASRVCDGAFPAWADDADAYQANVPAGMRLKATRLAGAQPLCLRTAAGAATSCGSPVETYAPTATALAASLDRGAAGAYSVRLEILPPDCGLTTDAADAPADATPLAGATPCTGTLAREHDDAEDHYNVASMIGVVLVEARDARITACATPGLLGAPTCVNVPVGIPTPIVAPTSPFGWTLTLRGAEATEYALTMAAG